VPHALCAVQPPYHKACSSKLVLFDGNSIGKVCKVSTGRIGLADRRSKADAVSRQRTDAPRARWASLACGLSTRESRTDIPYRALGNPSWPYPLWEASVST